jgi:tRNA uridine 5-carbamoylmethylation protein Kti12
MASDIQGRVPCSQETLGQLRSLKRGGERYEDLLQRMINQYDPPSPNVRQTSDAEG